MKKRKWLIYTVLIGLLPFFIRLFIYLVVKDTTGSYVLNEVDLVTFGLVLNLTNINELENVNNVDKNWKTTNVGLSVFFLIMFACFLGIAYVSDLSTRINFDKENLKKCALVLGIVSLVASYSIYNRLNTLP